MPRLEAKARARASRQLESRLSESPESGRDADRARSESVRWARTGRGPLSGPPGRRLGREEMLFKLRPNRYVTALCGLVTTAARVYIGGRGVAKHLQIAITSSHGVARATRIMMCGVTETDHDCSCGPHESGCRFTGRLSNLNLKLGTTST